MRTIKLPAALAAAVLLWTASPLLADPRTLAGELREKGRAGTIDAIVQFVTDPGDTHFKSITNRGGKLRLKLKSARGGLFTIPASQLETLSANPAVRYISPNRVVTGKLEFANPATGAGIAQQYGWTGAGVGIAILDSGVAASHPDLSNGGASRVVYSQNFVA
jgi:serine protease AprX